MNYSLKKKEMQLSYQKKRECASSEHPTPAVLAPQEIDEKEREPHVLLPYLDVFDCDEPVCFAFKPYCKLLCSSRKLIGQVKKFRVIFVVGAMHWLRNSIDDTRAGCVIGAHMRNDANDRLGISDITSKLFHLEMECQRFQMVNLQNSFFDRG